MSHRNLYRSSFAHQRLDVYHVAQDLVEACARLTKSTPRGYAEIRDQARRASLSVVRQIADAANRAGFRDKRARFVVARGEAGELDATLESAARLGLYPVEEADHVRRLADRVGAMLTGIIRRPAPA